MNARALLLAAACSAAVDLRVAAGGKLDLTVQGAPLDQVLDCLSTTLNLKVTVEGGALPRATLSLDVRDRSMPELLLGLLEGLGLNYAFMAGDAGRTPGRLLLFVGPAPNPPRAVTQTPRQPGFGGDTPPGSRPTPEDAPVEPAPSDTPPGAQPDLGPAAPPGSVPGIPGPPPPTMSPDDLYPPPRSLTDTTIDS
jgi:hypothetical protein